MQYVSLLKHDPTPEAVASFGAVTAPGEHSWVSGRAVHLAREDRDQQSTITNATVEKHLGVATNRNLTVVAELARRWC
jgi:hypothetical protein